MKAAAPWLALAMQTAAFWPVWRWQALRFGDGSDEGWCVLALLGVLWVAAAGAKAARERRGQAPGSRRPDGGDEPPRPPAGILSLSAVGPAAAACLYAAAYPWLPPLARAVLAVLSVTLTLPSLGLRPGACLQAASFLLLSQPAMASLQFYLGYPLRAACGAAACKLVNLAGYPAILDGTQITWADRVLLIDAPCSGVKMLWAGMFLGTALAAGRGLGALRTAALLAGSAAAVLAGNALRTTALFFLETGVVSGPDWAHAAIGVAAFLAAAGLMAAFAAWAGSGFPSATNATMATAAAAPPARAVSGGGLCAP